MTQPTPGGNVVDRRMALAREWDDLVEQVRRLDGFEDFLRPPKLENLLPAAARGPVAIINVSRWRCDALLVRPSGVTAEPLASLSLNDATDRANEYLRVLHAAELADLDHVRAQAAVPGETPHNAAKRMLRADRAVEAAHERVDAMLHDLQDWMWRTIAEPVLDALGFTGTPDSDPSSWPRLWWCPTGPLTLLPLHTAGDHLGAVGGGSPTRTVLDRVVSSYTPTLRALLEARKPDHETSMARGQDRLLLVDVPDAPGQIPLDTSRAPVGPLQLPRRPGPKGSIPRRAHAARRNPDHRRRHRRPLPRRLRRAVGLQDCGWRGRPA
jgi:hypothetical protein